MASDAEKAIQAYEASAKKESKVGLYQGKSVPVVESKPQGPASYPSAADPAANALSKIPLIGDAVRVIRRRSNDVEGSVNRAQR